MSHKTRRLAYLIRTDVRAIENDQDAQIAQLARFIATMCEARINADVPAFVGHDAIMSASRALTLQIESRDKFVQLHEQLSEVAGQVGIRELATGGGDKVPPGFFRAPSMPLQSEAVSPQTA